MEHLHGLRIEIYGCVVPMEPTDKPQVHTFAIVYNPPGADVWSESTEELYYGEGTIAEILQRCHWEIVKWQGQNSKFGRHMAEGEARKYDAFGRIIPKRAVMCPSDVWAAHLREEIPE
jgi:hypothetical protein